MTVDAATMIHQKSGRNLPTRKNIEMYLTNFIAMRNLRRNRHSILLSSGQGYAQSWEILFSLSRSKWNSPAGIRGFFIEAIAVARALSAMKVNKSDCLGNYWGEDRCFWCQKIKWLEREVSISWSKVAPSYNRSGNEIEIFVAKKRKETLTLTGF